MRMGGLSSPADDLQVLHDRGQRELRDGRGIGVERLDLDLETGVGRREDAEALLLVVRLPVLPAPGGHPEAVDQDDRVGSPRSRPVGRSRGGDLGHDGSSQPRANARRSALNSCSCESTGSGVVRQLFGDAGRVRRAVGQGRAARVEPAAAGDPGRVGHLALEHDRLDPLDLRHDRQQGPGVRVLRRLQDLLGRAALDDPAEVHHRDPVGDVPGQPEVVGDDDDAEPERRRAGPAAAPGSPPGSRRPATRPARRRPAAAAAAPAHPRSAPAASARRRARGGSAGRSAPAGAGPPPRARRPPGPPRCGPRGRRPPAGAAGCPRPRTRRRSAAG